MSLYAAQVTGEVLAASTAETILMIVAGATPAPRVKLRRWGVSFNGTSVTNAPVQVQLLRFTANGSSSSGTPMKLNESDIAAFSTFRSAFTAEPTTSDILESHYITPAGGLLVETYFDDAPILQSNNGRIGIRVLGNDAVNVSAFMHFEE